MRKNLDEVRELQALEKLVNEFAAEMKKKLFEVVEGGRWGYIWRDPLRREKMRLRILANEAKGDMVDVANFAAFIWNIDKE